MDNGHWLIHLRDGLREANTLIENIANCQILPDTRQTRNTIKLMPSRRNWTDAVRDHLYGNHGFADWVDLCSSETTSHRGRSAASAGT